ncbi:MAG: Hsp70 family protein, partial [Clostridia bacterium]|nr:Hsp70 family protein [Clostridia bacterium]
TASTNLSEEDIDKAVKEAEQYAEEDKKRKEVVENKQKLDGMIFSLEKAMKDMGDKLTEEEKAKLETEITAAKEELASDDDERIVKATERLANESQGVFARVYQEAQAAAQQAQNENPDNGQAN